MSNPNDLTEREVRELLGLSAWEFRQVKKEIPRIVYNQRVIRYDRNDVIYWRDGKKQGGWIGKGQAA